MRLGQSSLGIAIAAVEIGGVWADVGAVKGRLGVLPTLQSCHTAVTCDAMHNDGLLRGRDAVDSTAHHLGGL